MSHPQAAEAAIATPYVENAETVREASMRAFKVIQDQELSPTPEVYEVWFAYFAARKVELTREIEQLIEDEAELNDAVCVTLYNKHFGETDPDRAIKDAGEQMTAVVEEVARLLEAAGSGTGRFGEALDSVAKGLNRETSVMQLRAMVDELVMETGRMLDQNRMLQSALEESSDTIDELKDGLEVARRESVTDGLTGLPNRRFFDEKLKAMANEAVANEKPLALLMVDIDHFKHFNDEHGHMTGDLVLKLVGKTLQSELRSRDLVCRYGGEEFAVLLPNTDKGAALSVANMIRKSLSEKKLINRQTGDNLGQVTMSGGVAIWGRDDSLTDFVERADDALYAAKQEGRDRIVSA
ncbi:MAG: GGDEF domain-containing protein [Alphaproteobacteria bacterium]